MKSQSRRAADSADEPPPAPAKQNAENATGETADPTATMTSGFHAAVAPRHHVESHPQGKRLAILSLTALGVVYGDIGTSPLYALQQCFTSKEFALAPTTQNVYGVL